MFKTKWMGVCGVVIFMLTAIPAGFGFAEESVRPLTLGIRSDKDVYTRGEDITIGLTFRNNSGAGQVLKFDEGSRLHAFFSFELFLDGKQIKAYRNIDAKGMQFPMMERQLLPGESYSMNIVINRLDWNLQDWPHGSPFDRKGMYDIRVIYFGVSAVPEDNVISNTITIEVKGKSILGWLRNMAAAEDAEASEQQVVYTDMIEAYEQKHYTDARQLARRHLDKYRALAETAKNDFDLEAALRRALGVLHSALSAESALENEDRDAEFSDFLREELGRTKEAAARLRNVSESVKIYIDGEIGQCAAIWIHAAKDLIPRAELERFWADFKKELNGKGFMSLDVLVQSNATALVLTLTTEKKTYSIGEEIWIEFKFKNVSEKAVELLIFGKEIQAFHDLEFFDDKGNRIPSAGLETQEQASSGGETIVRREEILPGREYVSTRIPLHKWKIAGLSRGYNYVGSEARKIFLKGTYFTPIGINFADRDRLFFGRLTSGIIAVEVNEGKNSSKE